MIFRDKTDSSFIIPDLKEISKRTFQLGLATLVVCLAVIIYYLFRGIYLSTIFSLIVCILIGTFLWLNSRGLVRYTKPAIAILLSIYLIIDAFSEGLRAGGYLFYFPLLFGITILIDNNKSLKELTAYFIVCTAAFFSCLYFADANSKWQNLSDEEYSDIFYINSTASFILCIGFCYLNLFFEKKYAKALVEQKNKAEEAALARSRFLSNMSHELRTPLNGIIGAIDILGKGSSLPEQEEYLNILKYCSDHMLQQVNDILDYNKIEAGKLELHPVTFNLKELLSKSVIPFYNRFEEQKLTLNVEVEDRLDEFVVADDVRLIQIFNNLISNAVKFTEKGSVTLNATCIKKHKDELVVRFSVKDTGIGIAIKDQKRIFEGFAQVANENTRKFGGSGLGLSITRRLLNLMNSDLELYSELGLGTEFTFDIKFKIAKREKRQVEQSSYLTEDLTGLNLLVAEDNLINMMILKKLLQDWNVSTLTACVNGKEVLEKLSENSDYNLILLDLEMPEMDGYAAIKIIKEQYPHIPVIAFTASLVDNEMYKSLIDQGFSECILKPFQSQQLLAKIKEFATPVAPL